MKMKISHFLLVAFIALGFTACSDDDSTHSENASTPIQAADLPQTSKAFLQNHFPDAKVTSARQLHQANAVGTYYVTTLSNNYHVSFDTDGDWTSVNGHGQAVPQAVLPQNVLTYIQSNYPDVTIDEIDVQINGYEVELVNDIELYFDSEGNFIAADYDNNDDDDDDETPINYAELPQSAQSFIATNFPDAMAISIVKDNEEDEDMYEVKLDNGIELNFNRQGQWTEIESNGAVQIPESLIPEQVLSYVQAHFSGAAVKSIEKEDNEWRVELSNGEELSFDSNGQSTPDNDTDSDEIAISFDELPQVAQDFMVTYFQAVGITSITKEQADLDSMYEIHLQNGFELEFDQNGRKLDKC